MAGPLAMLANTLQVATYQWADFAGIAPAVLLGLCGGALSMAVYGRCSPQQRLRELNTQIAALQRQMADYDGEFAGAMVLTRQNLALAFRRLLLALGPAVASSVPVLALLPAVGASYIAYFIAVTFAAIVVKVVWRVV